MKKYKSYHAPRLPILLTIHSCITCVHGTLSLMIHPLGQNTSLNLSNSLSRAIRVSAGGVGANDRFP